MRNKLLPILIIYIGISINNNVFACDKCFYSCYHHVKNWEGLSEQKKRLSISTWFGAYSETRGKRDDKSLARDIPNEFSKDKKIKEYIKLINHYITHVPLETLNSRNAFNFVLDAHTLPLIKKSNVVFLNLANNEKFYKMPLFDITFSNPNDDVDVPKTISLNLYAISIFTYGGAMESEIGYNSLKEPIPLMSKKVNIEKHGSYRIRVPNKLPNIFEADFEANDVSTNEALAQKDMAVKNESIGIILEIKVLDFYKDLIDNKMDDYTDTVIQIRRTN